MDDKLLIIEADGEALVGWSKNNVLLQMGLVESLELGSLINVSQTSQQCDFGVVGDLISLQYSSLSSLASSSSLSPSSSSSSSSVTCWSSCRPWQEFFSIERQVVGEALPLHPLQDTWSHDQRVKAC